ncbi:MAG: ATP-binding cassette domain-containing protein [Peptoniphilaceae bacterium]|nr:ATP-binding cassette domain-containing protein [Peptoniphilaceae bacterium]MDD7383673.1 ATP-binding cassette domain-containing protein [Peptoniphilaceae bacterium]MDY3738770.1 ATP-binding cassette domain-containing protein [Peptoniphilaceae bacterium]
MSDLLEMRGIVKEFPGVRALNGVNFDLRKGEVHALMGENGAGKSTLMKCLFGIYEKDQGEIKIEGKTVNFKNSKDALDNGVAMVHQELNQVMKRSIAENLMMGRVPTKHGLVDHKAMYKFCQDVFDNLGLDFNPKDIMETKSVAERQLIEIAKAVSYNAKILVLDEPTSSLTEKEVEKLFSIMNTLRDRGVGIIYISHKIEEILNITDRVTILRDGTYISTEDTKNLTSEKIISSMVGREMTMQFPERHDFRGDVLLEVKNLTGKYGPTVHDASFTLRKGEILGIAGLVGARRTELVETIFGLREKLSGDIILEGKKIENSNPEAAKKNGFALVTEERRLTGIFPDSDITFNSTIANLSAYETKKVIDKKGMIKDSKTVIDSMKVKTPNQKAKISNLSGGNQQKVIIGRWLLTSPKVLLLDEPTRGIDVGAKYEIYELIIKLAKEGKGVIVISSEMTELMGICNRIIVMSNGRIAGEAENDENLTQEKIMALQAKYV